MDALKVVIVDDQKMVSSGFSLILSVEDDIDVVATATNGAQALDMAREVRPDVTLMDVQMPVMDGIEATRRFVDEGLGRVVILTTFDRDDYLFSALDAGASGFLLKNSDAEHRVGAVRAVGRGHALLAPEVTRRVISRMVEGGDTGAAAPAADDAGHDLTGLTEREHEVMLRVAAGKLNKIIADELNVSIRTVEVHRARVFAKLGVRSAAEVATLLAGR